MTENPEDFSRICRVVDDIELGIADLRRLLAEVRSKSRAVRAMLETKLAGEHRAIRWVGCGRDRLLYSAEEVLAAVGSLVAAMEVPDEPADLALASFDDGQDGADAGGGGVAGSAAKREEVDREAAPNGAGALSEPAATAARDIVRLLRTMREYRDKVGAIAKVCRPLAPAERDALAGLKNRLFESGNKNTAAVMGLVDVLSGGELE
jgi:hypothetical protein